MTLVDSNILLDLIAGRQEWTDWSKYQLERASLNGSLIINDIVDAEISVRFTAPEKLDALLQHNDIEIAAMPRAALFLAGKIFLRYRTAGGTRTGVLPDFFIGAHATVERIPSPTRDRRRYRHYFPALELIAPEEPRLPAATRRDAPAPRTPPAATE